MSNGQKWRLALRLAGREFRAGLRGFRILLACLTLGVAAIAAVGTMSASVSEGLRADGTTLLGGDIDVRLVQRAPTDDELAYLHNNAQAMSRTVDMRVMAANSQKTRALAQLKAVDDAYPLVGAMELSPPMPLAQALAQANGVFGTVVEPNLLIRLGLVLGDRISVGATTFELRATVVREPDRVTTVANFGPRLMIAAAALDATKLIQPGSQIHYHQRLALPAGVSATDWIAKTRKDLPQAGWRLRDASNAAPGLSSFLDRLTLFLSFAGLTALLVGGIGVGNAIEAYLERKTKVIATLKCIGADSGLIGRLYGIQIAALTLLGIILGLVVGAGLPVVALTLMGDLLPVRAQVGVYPEPLVTAALFGIAVATTFTLWPLLRAQNIPAARLFRASVAAHPGLSGWRHKAIIAGAALALAGLTVALVPDHYFGIWFVIGTIVALAALRVGADGITRLAKRVNGARHPAVRLGIGNLHRPGNRTQSVTISLGLGLAVLIAVTQIEGNLRAQVDERLPERAPALFFIDIQPHQVADFDQIVTQTPGTGQMRRMPSLRGRIIAIKGVPVAEAKIDPGSSWAVRGDRALTYVAEQPADTKITQGAWWPVDYAGPPKISLDAGLGRGFGVGLGDKLTLNILGRNIDAEIASLREIDWRSMRFDFAIIFAPGTLETAPHSHIAAVEADPDAEEALEQAVSGTFANVSAIRVREALNVVRTILEGVGAAVRGASAITLVTGALVLAGAIAAGHDRRVYDAVVFKVLGARRRTVVAAYLVEYGILGLATGLIAALVGTMTSWAVMVFLMGSEWIFLPTTTALTVIACTMVTLAGGLIGTWRALGRKAAPLLRNP